MKPGKIVLYQGLANLNNLYTKEMVIKKYLKNWKYLVVACFVFYTLKVGAEQLAMIAIRHSSEVARDR